MGSDCDRFRTSLGPGHAHPKGLALSADGNRPHVLVVNDTQEILDLMQELLEEEGYRVTTSLALLNIGKVKELAPDVIVQDLLFEQSQEVGWKFLTLFRLDPDVAPVLLILCFETTACCGAEVPPAVPHRP